MGLCCVRCVGRRVGGWVGGEGGGIVAEWVGGWGWKWKRDESVRCVEEKGWAEGGRRRDKNALRGGEGTFFFCCSDDRESEGWPRPAAEIISKLLFPWVLVVRRQLNTLFFLPLLLPPLLFSPPLSSPSFPLLLSLSSFLFPSPPLYFFRTLD